MRRIEPAQFIGARCGSLVIESLACFGEWGGKRYPVYHCRCDCGGSIEMIHPRLFNKGQPGVSACNTCRFLRTCLACGKKFISRTRRTTCSDECKTQIRRARNLEFYYRMVSKNPNLNRERHLRRRQLASENPEAASRMAEYERRSQIRKKERFLALPIEEQLKIREAERERGRAFYYENHKRIRDASNERRKANREEVNAKARLLWRKRKAKKAEKELIELQEKIERLTED